MRHLITRGLWWWMIVSLCELAGHTQASNRTDPHTEEEEPPDSAKNFTRYRDEHVKYHSDRVCNRTHYNVLKRSFNRKLRRKTLRLLVGLAHEVNDENTPREALFPPGERILHCPEGDSAALPDWSVVELGLDTTWVVENSLDRPVRLSLVDYQEHSGQEMSPYQPWLLALKDAQTIIEPGKFRGIQALEVQVFRVRAVPLAQDGMSVSNQDEPGPVLLQYRAGVREVAADYSRIDCDPRTPDIKPPRNETGRDRVAPKENLKCHAIVVGFRNLSPCPLNAYFIHNGTESFRYHLGTNHSVHAIMQETWSSSTKFETTYIPHSFIIRHATTNEFFQRYTLQPTRIRDCGFDNAEKRKGGEDDTWQDHVIVLPTGDMVQTPENTRQ